MKLDLPKLFTPVYAKLSDDMPWPEHETVFYLLTRDGCFLCRNHPFFRSSVAAESLPAELASHDAFLRLSYPKLSQRQFERVIGFFDIIGERFGAEAASLLVWNANTRSLDVIVPPQTSIVSSSWSGRPYPIEVHYEVPPLASHQMLVGDIHSHVDGAACASYTDHDDETHRPGLHIVVGRIREEPPEFHIDVVVDQTRFRVKHLASVVQSYSRRRMSEVPQAWIDQVHVMTWSAYESSRRENGMKSRTELGTDTDHGPVENCQKPHETDDSVPSANHPDANRPQPQGQPKQH